MKLNSFMLICLFSFYISFHLFERKLKVIRFDCPLKYNCQLYSVSVYYLQSLSHSFHFLALTPLVFIVLFFQSEMYMRLALRWLVAYIFIILSGNESVWPSLCHVLQNIFFFVLFFLTYSMVTRTATKKNKKTKNGVASRICIKISADRASDFFVVGFKLMLFNLYSVVKENMQLFLSTFVPMIHCGEINHIFSVNDCVDRIFNTTEKRQMFLHSIWSMSHSLQPLKPESHHFICLNAICMPFASIDTEMPLQTLQQCCRWSI